METSANTPTQQHVASFLSYLEPSGKLADIGQLMARVAETDAETRENLAALREWVGKPHTQPKQRTMDTVDQLLPVLYLRARGDIAAGRIATPRDLKKHAARARTMVEKLEGDFVEKLLAETRSRQKTDTLFARKVELAKTELDQASPKLQRVAAELIPRLGPDRPVKQAQDSAPGAIVSLGGRGRCAINGHDAPCWAVIGIVIIAIAIKL
ncbi:MAG TPA: hypothetical protein VN493_13090 [Thermoanaerobaculia bacterium]|nr:hypothetical protein [Thermoanaerobaculia bacterium]